MTPLDLDCTHAATPAEQQRDPGYLGCMASAGQPCRWAARADGVADPAFHSERFEAAAGGDGSAPQFSLDRFNAAALASGLI